MPTFDTPGPISANLELGAGRMRIVAGDRHDTVVEVRPTDPAKRADVAAAEATRIDYSGNRLVVKTPKGWWQYALWNPAESVDVLVELPAGSEVRVAAGVVTIDCDGPLGRCRFRTGAGTTRVADAGSVDVHVGAGDVTVERAGGPVSVTTGSGAVDLGRVTAATVKNANGDTRIGEATGAVRVSGANGAITVGRALDSVVARTANGDIRLHQVGHGSVQADTAFGTLDIGVRDGVAAWLDLHTHHGTVHNDLEAIGRPGPADDKVKVRARTAMGDITITRVVADPAGAAAAAVAGEGAA